MSTNAHIELAINQIRGSRIFTKRFLTDLTDAEWFWMPPQYTTHIAWQIGHIATAQYGLCLRRVRGRTKADESLISGAFIEAFTIGSKPVADPKQSPPLEEIKRVLDAVFDQSVSELQACSEADLNVPLDEPHPVFKTKLSAVEFTALHEMVHAGQIAMLRRLMGKPPLR
jgi:hypothetical protein